MKLKIFFTSIITSIFLLTSCSPHSTNSRKSQQEDFEERQSQLQSLLLDTTLSNENRYAIINTMAGNLLTQNKHNELVLFLTDWVERHPDDIYNTYWLFMTAYAYMLQEADPVAEYYLARILENYPDILVKGQSIHFLCLQHLIRICTKTSDRIKYFNDLIARFPADVSITELYIRLALEYEKEGEWDQALKACSLFLEQPDASTIQIVGIPDAYASARQLIAFNNSPKDWTFESLDALQNAIKKAISTYNWRALDSYKSKVNFFATNWNQETATIENAQEDFSMRSFMRGNSIHFNTKLDDTSNPNEAYLRTWGWSQYISIWYLYFRKVNFPVDPDIHGRWEWAGIYFGEKL